MKRIALLALVAATFLLLPACCGSEPMSMEWQPLPTFKQKVSYPTQTVTVPMVPQQAVQYSQPCAPAQPYVAPLRAPCN